MDFTEASRLGSCLAKDYAREMFRLLATYESISASEAASRLSVHIKTIQDFLEELYSLEIAEKEEVYEGKRPYFRYSLKVRKITFELKLGSLESENKVSDTRLRLKIREKNGSSVKFNTSRSNDYISSITIWSGEGRNRSEKKINLSWPQGRFLFHLPFPTAEPMEINDILKKAGVDITNAPEILDIVYLLLESNVIESL